MKRTLLALSVAAAVSIGMPNIASASVLTADTPIENNNCEYQWFSVSDDNECEEFLKELFENCDVYLNDLFLKNCVNVKLFNCNIQLPECPKPEISAPEVSEPETSAPETSAPETSEPETEQPETSAPEISEPETEEPETSAPDISEPETEEPETSAPDISEPETSGPEISTPEASAPETSAPETSAPETEETTTPDASVHPYVLRIVELVNEERAKAGLNPVTLDAVASEAALVRAKETVQLFSHTRPDGRSCFTALTEQGIRYRTAGENIAYGQRSPEEVMEGWMNSSGHRANILNASFTHIGVGYYQVNGVNYWTQMFFS